MDVVISLSWVTVWYDEEDHFVDFVGIGDLERDCVEALLAEVGRGCRSVIQQLPVERHEGPIVGICTREDDRVDGIQKRLLLQSHSVREIAAIGQEDINLAE